MKELVDLVSDVESHLAIKEQSLENISDSYVQGKLKNIKVKIAHMREMIKQVTQDPTLKSQILKNFTNSKKEIIDDINNLN